MLIPFSPEHLDNFHPTKDAMVAVNDPRVVEKLTALADKTLCATVMAEDGGTVLGIVGAIPLPFGTCEVLVISSEDQKHHAKTFTKGVKKSLDIIRGHFATIQTIGEDTPFFERWFTWLGFKCEGPCADRPEFGGTQMTMWRLE